MASITGTSTVDLAELGCDDIDFGGERRTYVTPFTNNNWGVRSGKNSLDGPTCQLTGDTKYDEFNYATIDAGIAALKKMRDDNEEVLLTWPSPAGTTINKGTFTIRAVYDKYPQLDNGQPYACVWTLDLVEIPEDAPAAGP